MSFTHNFKLTGTYIRWGLDTSKWNNKYNNNSPIKSLMIYVVLFLLSRRV